MFRGTVEARAKLIQSLTKYKEDRMKLREKTGSEYRLEFLGLKVGIKCQDKLDAVGKMIDELDGKPVTYNPADIIALRNRRLGKILSKHGIPSWFEASEKTLFINALTKYRDDRQAELDLGKEYRYNFFCLGFGDSGKVKIAGVDNMIDQLQGDHGKRYTEAQIDALRSKSLGAITARYRHALPKAFKSAAETLDRRNDEYNRFMD